jgi:hypothetical protein
MSELEKPLTIHTRKLIVLGIVITHEIFFPHTAWYFVVPNADSRLMAGQSKGGYIVAIIEKLCFELDATRGKRSPI